VRILLLNPENGKERDKQISARCVARICHGANGNEENEAKENLAKMPAWEEYGGKTNILKVKTALLRSLLDYRLGNFLKYSMKP